MGNVIVVTHWLDGDVVPYIRIAKELKRRGHNVKLITHCYFENMAKMAGLEFQAWDTPEEYAELVDLMETNKNDHAFQSKKFAYSLKMNVDNRGSFIELLHTEDCGQVSINISKPGITKGQHWHHSKWEQFIVVHGHGLLQERNINTNETVEFEVSGDKIEAIYMIPGWTHNIINLSDTEDLVTVMWASETLDKDRPDTYFEPV